MTDKITVISIPSPPITVVSVGNGVQGIQGIPGPTSPGTPGETGLSAYDVAVTAGFIGDEAAWLNSLKSTLDHGELTGLGDLDHPASAISVTPFGNIVATNVQAALAELDSDKQPAGSYASGTGSAIGTNTGDQDLSSYLTSSTASTTYQPLTTVLTDTTASYTTAIDSRLANTSGNNTGDQVIPTELPASDVYAWAKTTNKPGYAATEISNTPSGSITATTVQAALVELDSEKAALGTAQAFTAAQRGTPVALTSTAASMAINLASSNHFTHMTSENTTLAAPGDPVAGQSGVIVITQGAVARLLAYNTFWKFAGGTIPTLTATIGAVDVLAYYVESATRATCQLLKDVK